MFESKGSTVTVKCTVLQVLRKRKDCMEGENEL